MIYLPLMTKEITFEESVIYWLNTWNNSGAFSKADLLIFLYGLKKYKVYKEYKVTKLRSNTKLSTLSNRALSFLEENSFIKLTDYNYYILRTKKYSPLELICSVYPYGYISFSTAMEFYNLIDSDSKNIDFVIPTRIQWKQYEQSVLDALDINEEELSLRNFYHSYPSKSIKFNRKKVDFYVSKNLLSFTSLLTNIRVIEIGSLFLDMLHHNDRCGGFDKVIEVFDNHGVTYINEIIAAANLYGSNLDKSKLGYIFEERLGITHPDIENWKKSCISRGGSRKMISSEPYSDIYSETWCISLNHSIFTNN